MIGVITEKNPEKGIISYLIYYNSNINAKLRIECNKFGVKDGVEFRYYVWNIYRVRECNKVLKEY